MTQQMGSSTMFGELLKFPEHKVPLLQTKRVISNEVKESVFTAYLGSFTAYRMTKMFNHPFITHHSPLKK